MTEVYYAFQAERWAESAWVRLKLTPPCDLAAVCDFLNVSVVKELMAPDLDGVYFRDEHGNAQIRINSGILPIERQRFTWAHEIGHHCFARNVPGKVVVELRKGSHHPLERECNNFARALLMPADLVKLHCIELKHPEQNKTGTLASRFGVSMTAMRYRLRDLGLEHTRYARRGAR